MIPDDVGTVFDTKHGRFKLLEIRERTDGLLLQRLPSMVRVLVAESDFLTWNPIVSLDNADYTE